MTSGTVIYDHRAAQEALTNIQRHAQAERVWMDMACDSRNITFAVGVDGVGTPLKIDSSSFGLRGLRERAAQLGGEVRFDNRAEGGSVLKIVLPLAEGARS